MGIAHFSLVAVSSVLTALYSLVATAPPSVDRDLAFIESVVFQTPILEFDRSRFILRRQYRWFDWSKTAVRCQWSAARVALSVLRMRVGVMTLAIAISNF